MNYIQSLSDEISSILENPDFVNSETPESPSEVDEIKSTISDSLTSSLPDIPEEIDVSSEFNEIIENIISKLFDDVQKRDEKLENDKFQEVFKIDFQFIQFYEIINKSILQGEYVYSKSKDVLRSIISQVESGLISIGISNNVLFNSFQNLIIVLNQYILFIEEFDLKVEHNHIFLFQPNLTKRAVNASDFINDWFLITELNLHLCSIDINYSVKNDKIDNLIHIYEQFVNGKLNQYIDRNRSYNETVQLIFQKLSFLLLKFKLRFSLDKIESHDSDPSSIASFLININDQKLQSLKINYNVFENFCNEITRHYEINLKGDRQKFNFETDPEFINLRLNQINFSSIETIDFIKFHKYIKYHKDYVQNTTQLNELLKSFELILKSSPLVNYSKYETYALDVFDQYLRNNLFSLKVEQLDLYKFNEVKEELSSIENGQFSNRLVHNYFPQYKFLNFFAIPYLENCAINLQAGDRSELKILPSNIKFIEQKLNNAFSYFDWCNERDFQHIQFPYDASTVEYTYSESQEKINLFLFSSFFLPTNYDKISSDLLEFKASIYNRKYRVELYKDMDLIQDEIKSNSNKSVEILAIFTALVVFTLSSVNLIASEKISLIGALLYLGIVGSVLTIFTFLIFMITSKSIVFDNRKKFFLIPVICSTILFLGCLFYLYFSKST